MRRAQAFDILVLDDCADDVFFLQQALRVEHCENSLKAFKSGKELIEYFETLLSQPDKSVPRMLLFLGLHISGMTGFEVLEFRRRHPLFRQIPVVVLSSSPSNHDIERAYDLGANAYLVKPCGIPALARMLRATVDFWQTVSLPDPQLSPGLTPVRAIEGASSTDESQQLFQ